MSGHPYCGRGLAYHLRRRHRQRSIGEIVGVGARIVGRSDVSVRAYRQSVVRTGRCTVGGSVRRQRLQARTDLRGAVEEIHCARGLSDPLVRHSRGEGDQLAVG